ncbi:MAG: FISUMP domain-containing protein [Bacteroidales bacterium]
MGTYQERIMSFKSLPLIKSKLREITLRQESLEKIRTTISEDNFETLNNSYLTQIKELTVKRDELQAGADLLKNEIELESKMLKSEISIVSKEIQENQLLFENKILSKQNFKNKLIILKKRVKKDEKALNQILVSLKELDYYATSIGNETYQKNIYNERIESIRTGSSRIHFGFGKLLKPKVLIPVIILIILIVSSIFFHRPFKGIIEEEIAWHKTLKQNTYEAYDLYLLSYIDGRHRFVADKNKEEALRTLVNLKKTPNLVNQYLDTYPKGKFINEVQRIKDSIALVCSHITDNMQHEIPQSLNNSNENSNDKSESTELTNSPKNNEQLTNPAKESPKLQEGLINYWDFDFYAENKKTIPFHVGNKEAVVNEVSLTKDSKNGNAIDFNGKSSLVSIPHNSSFNTQTFTISFWAKSISRYRQVPISKWWNGTTRQWEVIFNDDNKLGNIRFFIGYNGSFQAVDFTTSQIYDGYWHLYNFTMDNGLIKIWIDGEEKASRNTGYKMLYNDRPIYIGQDSYFGETNYLPYNGIIDEVAIWERTLSSGDIQNLYNEKSILPSTVGSFNREKSTLKKFILDESYDLNDNQVPNEWELIVPSQEVIFENGKLFANPVDAYGFLRRMISIPNNIGNARFEWDGNLAKTKWGMTNRFQINFNNNMYIAVYLQTATAWGINNNKLLFKHDSGNGEQNSEEWKVPLKYGEFHYEINVNRRQIKFTSYDKETNAIYVDQIINIPSTISFSLQQITSVDFGVNCTTENSNWLDNISIKLIDSQTNTQSLNKKITQNNSEVDQVYTIIDGYRYKTIKIGDQIWMAENLKTTKYNDGTAIPLVTNNTAWSNLTTPGYCWYNNDAVTYKNTYGALYNWYTINTGKLCPAGWHVPSDAEWTTLLTYLGGKDVAGGKLKEIGTTHWTSSNTGATNETGFTALPGGAREGNGDFEGIGSGGCWWSTTEYYTNYVWYRDMNSDNSNVGRDGNDGKPYGLSVRCLKD